MNDLSKGIANEQNIWVVDPNAVNGDSNIIHPMEDLSIEVDLEVKTVPRFNNSGNEYYTLSWRTNGEGKKEASFLQGRKFNGGDSYLTDFYTDINFNNSREGDIIEGIGIKRINIDYNSWYIPQVTINFVDVRGSTLFNPSEYMNDTEGGSKGSFFKSFFSFPYPTYTLRIKGYLGDRVTYLLHCSDVRHSFDSNSGDFETTAKFIGFNFAFLSDIPFNLLKSIPYCEYIGGIDYWNSKNFQLNTMTYDESGNPVYTPMLPMMDYIEKINDISQRKKLEPNNENYRRWEDIKNQMGYINKILNAWGILSNKLKDTYKTNFKDEDKKISITGSLIPWVKNECQQYEDLIKFIKEYNEKYKSLSNTYIEIKEPSGLWNLIYGNKVNFKGATIDYNSLTSSLDKIASNINTESTKIKHDVAAGFETEVISTLGFKPTIDNIMRIIFAHLEVFSDCFYILKDKIQERKFSDIQKLGSSGDKFTDINIQGSDATFGSFPEFKGDVIDNNGEIEKNVEKWIGGVDGLRMASTGQDLDEVNLVYSILESVKYVREKESELSITSNVIEHWMPINPMDIGLLGVHKENPYNVLKKDGKGDFKVANLVIQILIRMYYGLLTNGNSNYKDLAKAESKNVFSVYSNDNDIKSLFVKNGSTKDRFITLGTEKPEQSVSTVPYIFTGNPLMVLKDEWYEYTYLKENNEDEIKKFATIPTYTATVDGYNKDWFNKNNDNKYSPIECTKPSLQRKIYSGSLVYDTNTTSFDSVFQIIPTDNNNFLEKLIGYKNAVGNNNLTKNWNLDEDFSLNLFINKKFDLTDGYENRKDGIITKKEFDEYFSVIKSESIGSKDYEFTGIKTDEIKVALIRGDIKYDNDKIISHNNTSLRSIRENNSYDDFVIPKMRLIVNENIDILDKFKGVSAHVNYYEDLFGSQLFYSQNDERLGDLPNNITKESLRNEAKGLLILSSLKHSDSDIDDLFEDENSGYYRVPKSTLLYIGGVLKRLALKNEHDIDLLGNAVETLNYKHSLFECRGKLTDMSSIFDDTKDNKVKSVLKPFVTRILIKYFEDWCKSDDLKNILDQYELKIIDNNTPKYINSASFESLCKHFVDLKKKGVITKDNLKNKFYKNLFDNYHYINFEEKSINLIYRPYGNMRLLLKLYSDEVVLLKGIPLLQEEEDKDSYFKKFAIEEDVVKTYIETICSELGSLYSNQEKVDSNINEGVEVNPYNDENICLELYKTLKSINDKWMATYRENHYTLVSRNSNEPSFYDKSFNFIDKFYNKIGDKVIINPNKFLNIVVNEDADDIIITMQDNLYQVLTSLVTEHKMLLVPTPNYIDWSKNGDVGEVLSNVFKPLSWSTRGNDVDVPQFTIIYIGEPSKHLELDESKTFNNFDGDGFNVSKDGKTNVEKGFSFGEEHKYQLPCFMVAFSAQNNSIFKNYSLNMDSSTVTDQSLGATFNISNMAKKGKNVSYGQDLYSIYTSNSYQIEIEMMGCAQIQPLMYFQLVNVPMFRGAYMIYKIAHNISPGDMTTHITGMRISNKPVALVKEVYNYDDMFDGLEIDVYGNTASPEYQKTYSNAVVYTGDTPYRAGTGTDYIYGGKAAGRYKDIDYIDYEKLKNTKFSEHIHLIHAVKNALDNKKSDEHYLARCKVMPKLIYNNIKGVAAQYELIRKHVEEEYKGEIVVKFNSIWRCRLDKEGKRENYTETFHGVGGAIDLQFFRVKDENTGKSIYRKLIANKNDSDETKKKNELWKILFWIREKLPYNEAFLEISTNSNLTWLHYAYVVGCKTKKDSLYI